jgi:VWFA-related protein
LAAADFDLRDNGVHQRIDVVTVEDVPLSVMLALDLSESVQGERLTHLKQAAAAAIEALKPADRAALLTFTAAIQLRAGWTSDRAAIRHALESLTAAGPTDLNDVAFAALTLHDERPGRALILLFTDGFDTAGWLPAGAALNAARRAEAVVYSVQLKDAVRPAKMPLTFQPLLPLNLPSEFDRKTLLPDLCEETGGRTFYADADKDLRETFVRVVDEFKSRYLLTYVPANVAPAGWHALDVKVRGRNVKVTARKGYQR